MVRRITTSWQDLLDDAAVEQDVVSLAKDFVATLDPQQLSRMPSRCRPRKMIDANDIVNYAVALARHQCGADAGSSPELKALAAFFSNATRRLSQLAHPGPEPDSDPQHPAA
jgi:hypothetical protein